MASMHICPITSRLPDPLPGLESTTQNGAWLGPTSFDLIAMTRVLGPKISP